jgi:hypothetical protein
MGMYKLKLGQYEMRIELTTGHIKMIFGQYKLKLGQYETPSQQNQVKNLDS